MICLNCGRPNPSGTSLCYRCRERRPGLERARGGVIYQRTRETARVKKRGSGILVVGVLLLAGLIFAGGTLAVFMAPKGPTPTNPGIAFNNATPSQLEIFEQITPTPEPTATPWFPSFTPGASPTDLLSFFPSPSGLLTLPPPTIPGSITPRPTRSPTATPTRTPTSTPTGTPNPTPTQDSQPNAKFNGSQQGNTKTAQFNSGNSSGAVSWQWNFAGEGSSDEPNPEFTFADYGPKDVTLTVTDADGDQDSITKTVQLPRPDCNENGQPPDCNPTPNPTDTPTVDPSLPVDPPAG